MGYANVEEMVKGFSQVAHTGVESNTWDGLAPGTDYEVKILPTDVNGTFGDMITVNFTTNKQGGEGIAHVDVTIGDYKVISGRNVQNITFTPNDQTSMFRDAICDADSYESNGGDTWATSYLQTEYPFEMPNWNHYSTDVYSFEAEPSKTYYALAIAKNSNGEWGPLVKKEFTTPASPAKVAPLKVSTKANKSAFMPRIINNSKTNIGGIVPMKKSLKLSESK